MAELNHFFVHAGVSKSDNLTLNEAIWGSGVAQLVEQAPTNSPLQEVPGSNPTSSVLYRLQRVKVLKPVEERANLGSKGLKEKGSDGLGAGLRVHLYMCLRNIDLRRSKRAPLRGANIKKKYIYILLLFYSLKYHGCFIFYILI